MYSNTQKRYGINRSIKSTTWWTFLVFCASFRQWKAWKAANFGRDAFQDFPGLDFERISKELEGITPKPMRFRGADNQVLKHLDRLSEFHLINYRPSESTDSKPKFVPQKQAEEVYDALVGMDLEPFLMSPYSKEYAGALMLLAVMKTRPTNLWYVESLKGISAMVKSQRIINHLEKLTGSLKITNSQGGIRRLDEMVEEIKENTYKLTEKAILGDTDDDLDLENVINQMDTPKPQENKLHVSGQFQIHPENVRILEKEAKHLDMTETQVLTYYLNHDWIPSLGESQENREKKRALQSRLQELEVEKEKILQELSS